MSKLITTLAAATLTFTLATAASAQKYGAPPAGGLNGGISKLGGLTKPVEPPTPCCVFKVPPHVEKLAKDRQAEQIRKQELKVLVEKRQRPW